MLERYAKRSCYSWPHFYVDIWVTISLNDDHDDVDDDDNDDDNNNNVFSLWCSDLILFCCMMVLLMTMVWLDVELDTVMNMPML